MSAMKIEDAITTVLNEEAQKNALDFVAHMRAKGVSIDESETYWEIKYKGKCLCFMWIDGSDNLPGPWTIWSNQEPGSWATWGENASDFNTNIPVDDHIKEIAWKNVSFCGNCGECETNGMSKIVLGKEFDNLCKSTMAFTNPNKEELACAKKMIDVRMKDIDNGYD